MNILPVGAFPNRTRYVQFLRCVTLHEYWVFDGVDYPDHKDKIPCPASFVPEDFVSKV